VKTISLGGGPAGLYYAILRKKLHPEDEIIVYERNAPNVTFGWGVVFSDETLGYLEENDPPTYEAIRKKFAYWKDIDVFYFGDHVRSTGHGFCGLARKDLLSILQARAAELGVQCVFGTEIDDPEPHMAQADLVLGADGVNSKVRARFADVFRPSLDVRKCKYIWLGTDLRLPAFTFIYEKNEHGVFQVHSYPFDDGHSTFIVECDEASWAAAGMQSRPTEDVIAYFERLFAKHLRGHRLLSNRSLWVSFPTVRSARWSHENVVLLGDAVHTAHFSIGSGTKLAMEDSISLVRALEEKGCHGDRVPRARITEALAAYEEARRPDVERLQRAAQDSLLLFENTKRYLDQAALEFTFNLMTRSKRITYENLKTRDPALVAKVTEDFAKRSTPPGAAPVRAQDGSAAPPMFTPYSLRGMTVENRVCVSPMCMYSAKDGLPNDFHLVHYGSLALGGPGILFTEMTCVSPDARITPGCAGLYTPEQLAAWKRIVAFAHAHSRAKVALQLGHAGRKGATKLMWEGMDRPLESGAWPIVAASPLPYYPNSQVPKELDRAGMDRVTADYVRATQMGVEAGFDMLELHMAHGYLLASFFSPLTNRRTDGYGGSLEARARFPLEVLRAVRAAWPEERPLSVRISAVDWEDGGSTEEDAVEIAKMLKSAGCDIVHVSTGQTTPNAKPMFGRMWQTRFADRIRHEARVPTIAVGNVQGADHINTILAAGRADLVSIARGHLADPHFTLHAAQEAGVDVPWPVQYELGKTAVLKPRSDR
jgi:anthraniloyl-CoA monooxygenase